MENFIAWFGTSNMWTAVQNNFYQVNPDNTESHPGLLTKATSYSFSGSSTTLDGLQSIFASWIQTGRISDDENGVYSFFLDHRVIISNSTSGNNIINSNTAEAW